jgi:hypothetical protein
MYVAVVHQVKDAQAFLSRGERLDDPSNAPPGVVPRQFCPSTDLSTATCVWEADSLDAARNYVDSTLGDSSENTYFEINTEYALGLPEPATTTQA